MTDRLTRARDAISAVFLTNEITAPPTRAAYTALSITEYPIMKVRRIFGSWDRAMKLIVKHTRDKLNAGPVLANALVAQSVAEGAVLSYQFASNTFTDADAGQTLTYSVIGDLPAGITFTDATRTFAGTAPAVTANTDYPVFVRATDDYGRFVEAPLTITVTAV